MADEAPKCSDCGQRKDFEARIAAILAFYGLKHDSDDAPDFRHRDVIRRIRRELEK